MVARPLALCACAFSDWCSSCSGFFPCSSFCRCSFGYDFPLHSCDSRSIRSLTCGESLRCSSCCFHRCSCGQPLRLACVALRPLCGPRLSAMPWSANQSLRRPFCRPYARSSCCSSSRGPTHSSCRRRLPCSQSPRRAARPHGVRHHELRSPPRCARPSASACWCKTTYRLVAWSCSPACG